MSGISCCVSVMVAASNAVKVLLALTNYAQTCDSVILFFGLKIMDLHIPDAYHTDRKQFKQTYL